MFPVFGSSLYTRLFILSAIHNKSMKRAISTLLNLSNVATVLFTTPLCTHIISWPKSLFLITLAPLYIIFIVFAHCPGCTIRNTPSEPIHCIVWSKHLFNQLFGESGDTLHYFVRGHLGWDSPSSYITLLSMPVKDQTLNLGESMSPVS